VINNNTTSDTGSGGGGMLYNRRILSTNFEVSSSGGIITYIESEKDSEISVEDTTAD
jgi:hypothetical protein